MIINRNNCYEHLLEKQFNIINKTIFDALFSEGRWKEWEITEKQYIEFRKYAIKLIRRVYKCNKSKGEYNFDWFYNVHGLKIK